MSKLILIRHGQSVWNKKNLFTGWVDVPLSQEGIHEALQAKEILRHIPIDIIFTSTLMRAQMTAMIVCLDQPSERSPVVFHEEEKLQQWGRSYAAHPFIPTHCAWQLNERMYGKLQGLNKAETAEKYGAEQVQLWRRSYSTCPPGGESLEMTAKRAIPYFDTSILPHLHQGKNVLVAAHGNSLRAIIMHIEKMTQEQILQFELPTGAPRIYDCQQDAIVLRPC